MRILLCHNSYRFRGGEDQVFEDECWLLKSRGCEVVTYHRSNRDLEQTGNARAALDTFWNRQSYRELRALIDKTRPDVVHCHNTFPIVSPSAYYAARRRGVPVVQTVHNYRLLCPKSLLLRDGHVCRKCLGRNFAWPAVYHACYKDSRAASFLTAGMVSAHWALRTWQSAVTRYVALTDFSRQTLVAGGIPRERIRVKANFVRPDPGLGAASGNYAVFVGRLSPEKGIEVLLDAWTRCRPEIPLWIVGEGPLEPLVRQAQVDTPSIRWLGLRDHGDVLRLIGEAKLLVFPSIWHETFGRCMIEAFAAGTPVIATDMAPMHELVKDRVTGLLFERSNAIDLAKQVGLLLEDSALRESLRRAGRLEYEQRYSAATNFDQLMEIYQEVVDDGAGYARVRSPQGGPQCSPQPVGHSHGK